MQSQISCDILAHLKSMFALRNGNWFSFSSVACSQNGNRNGYTNAGNASMAMAIWLQNNGNVLVETRHYAAFCWSRKLVITSSVRPIMISDIGHIGINRRYRHRTATAHRYPMCVI